MGTDGGIGRAGSEMLGFGLGWRKAFANGLGVGVAEFPPPIARIFLQMRAAACPALGSAGASSGESRKSNCAARSIARVTGVRAEIFHYFVKFRALLDENCTYDLIVLRIIAGVNAIYQFLVHGVHFVQYEVGELTLGESRVAKGNEFQVQGFHLGDEVDT